MRGHHACDVVIVGGGITGALIADTFAAEGTFASLTARLLLEHWRGIRSPDHRLFSFGRLR